MRFLKTIVSRLWRGALALSSLLGILYFWEDFTGLPDIFPFLEGVSMPSLQSALIGFSFLCIAYIFWMDIRPMVGRKGLKAIDVDGIGRSHPINQVVEYLVRMVRDSENRNVFGWEYFDIKDMIGSFGVNLRTASINETIEIYGKRPNSSIYEKITPDHWKNFYYIEHESNRAQDIELGSGPSDSFNDLMISQKDFLKIRKIVKSAKDFPEVFEDSYG